MERRDFLKYSATTVAGSMLLNQEVAAFAQNTNTEKPSNAYYIWYEGDDGKGRNLFGNFRRSFQLKATPDIAEFNIFADTSYQLFVNGQFVQYGPIRFDPRYPVYDKHNIKPFLKIGENVIAVQVNHYGCKTYKSINTRAGMVAWGIITQGKKNISLDTNKKDWKAKKSAAHEHYAYKMSFALNPVDFFDQSKEEKGWNNIGFKESPSWPAALEIVQQNNWGKPVERNIPFMSGVELPIAEVCHILPLQQNEDWYSFEVPVPLLFDDDYDRKSSILFKTWVYSEKNQEISVGIYFGEYWLNGEPLSRGFEGTKNSMRINQVWKLNAGWNYLFGSVRLYYDVLFHYFAVPKSKGIIFNADQQLNGSVKFYRSNILSGALYESIIIDKLKQVEPTDTISTAGGWQIVNNTDKAQSASRECAWDNYGQQIETILPQKLNGKKFSLKNYPEGFSITLDLGQTKLVIPKLAVVGVKDATVDICYSEQFTTDRQHLLQNFNYAASDRLRCSEDIIEWFPSTARGARYIKLTIRNITSDITIKFINIISANYPVQEVGKFSCSDPLMNAIWEMGKNTEAANMEDAYVDCPTRERGMYIRDTIIQYHVNLAAFGDQKLMRRCLELYGQSPDSTGKFRAVYPNSGDYTIADFSLNMLEGFKSYYDQTGDKELIRNYWSAMTKNLAWFDQLADERSDMLLDSEWHIKRKINAHYGGFHGDLGIIDGILSNTGIHCLFSTTYLIALQSAKDLALAINKKDDVLRINNRIKVLTNSINDKFWDPIKKCYADNLEKSTYSVHASLFAVRAGIADAEKLPLIKQHVTKNLPALLANSFDAEAGVYTSPSFAFYIFDGLYKAGLEDVAEKLIRQGWGWMLYKGFKTCPEYFTFDQSHCHAWSASPTYYLSKYVLGVHFPNSADTNMIEIKVQTNTIASAEGKFPHPKGAIEVKWHTENNKRIFDYVKAPPGVKVNIVG